jgi:hypothetical protein
MKDGSCVWVGLVALAAAAACGGSEFKADDPGGAGSGGAMSSGGASKGGSSSGKGGSSSGSGGSVGVSGADPGGGAPPIGGGSAVGGGPVVGGGPPMAGAPPIGGTGGGTTISTDPLEIADLTMIDAMYLDGFHAAGFRCKSLSVCGVMQQCIYYSSFLGSVQSAEAAYSDGDLLADGQAVKIRIANGAKSDCTDTPVSIDDGESIILGFNNGQQLWVYFPPYQGQELVLYVATDGSTYYDAEMTELARSRPLSAN